MFKLKIGRKLINDKRSPCLCLCLRLWPRGQAPDIVEVEVSAKVLMHLSNDFGSFACS